MDAVTGLLDGPRASAAFLLRSSMSPPWSLRIEDEAPLTVMCVVRGSVWLRPDDAPPQLLRRGDTAVLLGPAHYTVADHPTRAPQAIIKPGQRCVGPDGAPQSTMTEQGMRTWGNSPAGETELLTGTYTATQEVSRRLLRSLPPSLVLAEDEWDCPLVALLADEIVKDRPGQEAVLDRLLDLLLIAVLRAWFDRADTAAPAWYRAYGDPIVGQAIRQLQHRPDLPWTLEQLATTIGVSRATLARRFADLVGQPPMAFLTEWRITMAADLIRDPDATLESVARQVGYSSPYALSAAFKRLRGVSPRATDGARS